jgi:hypothetical protein
MGPLKEIVSSILSISIAAVTLWMLLDVFSAADHTPFVAEQFTRKKDILSIALGLFGAVAGYYFGRVPAEKQADAARGEAAAANNAAKVAQQSEERIKKVALGGLQEIENLNKGGGGNVDPNALRETANRLRAAII